jgi:phage recombination protein Bet
MGRPPGARNKTKTTTVADDMRDQIADEPTNKGEVAIFQPPRLPYHPAVEDRFGVDKGQWKVLVEAIYPAAKTVDAIVMALTYCKSRNLDPFKRPVHIVPMWDSQRGAMVETVWPGISELRTTASRTKNYAGIDAAEFGEDETTEFEGRVKENGNYVTKEVKLDHPSWCRITVWRIVDGQKCKFVGPKVRWLETYATLGKTELPNNMWQSRPEGQLEKCAEAAALRRAFPEEIGNELTAEEMIGRDIHSIAGEVEHVADQAAPATAASRDTGPPRTAPQTEQERKADVETTEVRDAEPPPRPAKTAPKEDPITSGPPRAVKKTPEQEEDDLTQKAANNIDVEKGLQAKRKPADEAPKPHRIPGAGHTYESWAEKYQDLLKTSPDIATVYGWIDQNSKEFSDPADPEKRILGPLTRLEKQKPSVYAEIKKTTEKVMQALRDAQKKAEEKEAKKAAKAAPKGDMDDGPAEGPSAPDDILKAIDAELAAVEDPDQLQSVWETACEPLMAKLDFPPDVDEAQAIFAKHEKRLGGD